MILPRILLRRLAAMLMPFLLALALPAQVSPSYELLWKVEGNGLSQSSYLFGSMHVKDRRAFQFSDSVMLALEQCPVFAMEVHPDSALQAMFGATLEAANGDAPATLQELLDEETYEQLSTRFREKNGFELEQVRTQNPIILQSMLEPDFARADDKETFVDAYLMGIAKTMNKEIIGLEEVKTQVDMFYNISQEAQVARIRGMLETTSSDYQDFMDEFVETYRRGSLDEIQAFIGGDPSQGDSIMIARNLVMQQSLTQSMQQQATFAVVGTAHLPGKYGLIQLLREAGYTLRPVEARFTGVADQYQVDLSKIPWLTFQDEENGFAIDFPGKAFAFPMFSELEINLYPDLATGRQYGAYAIDVRSSPSKINPDTMIQRMADVYRMKDGGSVLSQKKIIQQGFPGVEMVTENEEGTQITLQILFRENMYYGLFATSPAGKQEDVMLNRFFDSFRILDLKELPAEKMGWREFQHDSGAFELLLPVEPKKHTQISPNPLAPEEEPFVVHLWVSTDLPAGMNYIFAYNDLPPGYHLENPVNTFEQLKEEMATRGEIIGSMDTVWLDGIEGREIKLKVMEVSYMEGRIFIRGNRVYKFFRQSLKQAKVDFVDDEPFFSSIHFLPYQSPQTNPYLSEEGGFSFDGFSSVQSLLDTSYESSSHLRWIRSTYMTNPQSGGLYLLEEMKMSPYFYITSVDSFYQTYTDGLVEWTDTLLRNDSIWMGGIYGRDLLIKDQRTGVLGRTSLWLEQDHVMALSVIGSEEEMYNEATNTLMQSYRRISGLAGFDPYASKTTTILAALQSADTSEYAAALGALEYYEFAEAEVPLLEQALNHSYPDDDSQTGAKAWLIINLGILDQSSSPGALQRCYQAPGTSEAIKNTILEYLPIYSDPQGLATYLDLLFQRPPDSVFSSWDFFEPFEDSLPLVAQYWEQLAPLASRPSYRPAILSMASRLLASDSLYYQQLTLETTELLLADMAGDFDQYFAELEEEEDSYSRVFVHYLRILEKNPAQLARTDSLTQVLMNHPIPHYYRMRTIETRLRLDLSVSPDTLSARFADMNSRYRMMDTYESLGRWKDIPRTHRRSPALAELALWEYLSYEDGPPDAIELLGKISYHDSTLYAFSFTYEYEGESSSYLGLAGPFGKKTPTSLSLLKAYSDWETKEEDWQSQAKQLSANFERYAY